jgi:hypothetical protein
MKEDTQKVLTNVIKCAMILGGEGTVLVGLDRQPRNQII